LKKTYFLKLDALLMKKLHALDWLLQLYQELWGTKGIHDYKKILNTQNLFSNLKFTLRELSYLQTGKINLRNRIF